MKKMLIRMAMVATTASFLPTISAYAAKCKPGATVCASGYDKTVLDCTDGCTYWFIKIA